MDFTLITYHKLLDSLLSRDYSFQTYAEFLETPAPRAIILRHDVEAKYPNALAFARIQHKKNLRGSYYFRFLPDHFNTVIIREIAAMGHEIGYHYDDLSQCKGNYEQAIARFEKNLATLREIAEVKTICMEGAPLSKYDNRNLWKKYNYQDFGIIGEPYFDMDFSKVLYLTDTGRRWDGKGSVRDKVGNRQSAVSSQQSAVLIQNSTFHSTFDIIAAANSSLLPDQIMFTFHPQRWTDKPLPWVRELCFQNIKNIAKRFVLRFKD